jgi:sortase A
LRFLGRLNVFTVVAVVSFVLCLSMVGWVVFRQLESGQQFSRRAQEAVEAVSEWSAGERDAVLGAARAYNRGLFERGVPGYGEVVEPGSGGLSRSVLDAGYSGLLDLDGSGVMGRVLVPVVSVDLPILHTTSELALSAGAGHLYGTSVPVGGPDTHSVLSAHSGQLTAAMFLRLGELGAGDFMYVQTVGETLGYVVDRVEVVYPDDFSRFGIVPGEDRLTLMTCVPIGINTQRLLVSGLRHEIPDVVPFPGDAPDDWRVVVYAVLGVLLTLVATGCLFLWLRRRSRRVSRHRPARGFR